jgi:hypothetical protein
VYSTVDGNMRWLMKGGGEEERRAQVGQVAQVAFFITRSMKFTLEQMGYSRGEIANLLPGKTNLSNRINKLSSLCLLTNPIVNIFY